jgi:hypothetical protein
MRLTSLSAGVLMLAFAMLARGAAIEGTVVNGTTGKPQAGATVTLYRVSQNGPENLESVKTSAEGKFAIEQDVQGGPRLLQAAYAGVTYNKMLPPGAPSTGVTIPVYESSKRPGEAKVEQHMMLLEPSANGTLTVSESYAWKNDGKTTYNDPDNGTFLFALPAAARGKVEVSVLSPGGMPIRRAADPAGKPGTFKLDFPIKPGESRVDLMWSMPFSTPGVFEDRVLYNGSAPTRIVAPVGVTLKGDGVESLGQEPRTKASIYGVKGPLFRVAVSGTGSLRESEASSGQSAGGESGGPGLTQNLPKLYGLAASTTGLWGSVLAVKWILLTVLGMLALGFALLYRKGAPPEQTEAAASTKTQVEAKAPKHARGRR